VNHPDLPPSVVPTREVFSIGRALGRSIGVWVRNLPFFFGASYLALLPWVFRPPVPSVVGAWGEFIVDLFGTTVVGYLATGLVTHSVLEQLSGRRPKALDSLSVGWNRFGALLGAALLTGLLIAAGTPALVVPGIVLAVRWLLVGPVVVVENPQNPRARSSELTVGHQWGIFGLQLLVNLAPLVFCVAAYNLFSRQTESGLHAAQDPSWVAQLVIEIPRALILSFHTVVEGVVYFQLRSEREGIDLEQLTAVFR
jgi:hypothetical protein